MTKHILTFVCIVVAAYAFIALMTLQGCATPKEKVYVHCKQFPVRNAKGQYTGKYNYVCEDGEGDPAQ